MDALYSSLHGDVLTGILYAFFAFLCVGLQTVRASLDGLMSREGWTIAATLIALSVVFCACAMTGYISDHVGHMAAATEWEDPLHAALNLATMVLIGGSIKSQVWYRAFTAPGRAARAETARDAAQAETVRVQGARDTDREAHYARVERLAAHIPGVAYEVGPDWMITFSAGQGLTRFGLGQQELVGTDVRDFLEPWEVAHYRLVIEGKKSCDRYEVHIGADHPMYDRAPNQNWHIELTGVPWQHSDGDAGSDGGAVVCGITAFSREITEAMKASARREAEAEAADTLRKFFARGEG